MFLKAKQAPEDKPAGVSQETLAIAGLATTVLAAITFNYMVGHVCGVIGVLGLWPLLAPSPSKPALPLAIIGFGYMLVLYYQYELLQRPPSLSANPPPSVHIRPQARAQIRHERAQIRAGRQA